MAAPVSRIGRIRSVANPVTPSPLGADECRPGLAVARGPGW